MYTKPDSDERKHQEATYGPLDKFGYKDFIPMFTGSHFNADEWAELFKKAGARFAGPVAEHHDGFAMWNTKFSPWNAAKMGPKRDVVGQLSKAIKKQDMKFMTALHHAEHWFYFPVWDKRYDVSDPRYAGLYGQSHEKGALPDKKFLDVWIGKLKEVVDNYDPDLVWFDYGLQLIQQGYKEEFAQYYFNRAARLGKEVTITYKYHDLTPGVGIYDLELGRESNMTYSEWITDSTIDSGSGWGYVTSAGFKSVDDLVQGLVDRVSKNGFFLLNVGPKPDGTIPEPAKERLLAMGEWLKSQWRGCLWDDSVVDCGRRADPAQEEWRLQRRQQSSLHGRGYSVHIPQQNSLRDTACMAGRKGVDQESGAKGRHLAWAVSLRGGLDQDVGK